MKYTNSSSSSSSSSSSGRRTSTRHSNLLNLNLNNLSIKDESKYDDNDDTQQETHMCEIIKIIDHNRVGNLWTFYVKFKDGSIEWIKDTDTKAEWIINNYLETKNIKTVYCFCRVSTKAQASQEHVSLDVQSSQILSELNLTSTDTLRVKIYKTTSSAYKGVPKDLQIIAEACKSGDKIVVYRIDRLSRNIFKSLELMEDLTERGVQIYSLLDKKYYTDDKTETVNKILYGQRESEAISQRVKSVLQFRRNRGDMTLGSVPYGKQIKRGNNNQIIVENNTDEIEVINEIKKLARINNNKKICISLNNRLIRKRGKKWTPSMIQRLLRK